jgi:hypothetical protein
MEPEWTKSIPDATVCNFYYFFFVFYAVIAVITVLGTIGILFNAKLPRGLMLSYGFSNLLVFVLAGVSALFFYLVCDRALKPGVKKQ